MKEAKLRDGEALVLRTCNADMTGYGGFKWPESGPVSAPDWYPKQECGNGFHGLLRGEGIWGYLNTSQTARWLAVRVLVSECIDLGGKIKFPLGEVVMCGDRDAVVAFVQTHHPGAAVVYGTATSGDYGTSTSGDYGTSTSGYHGTATSGDYGTSTSGDYGTSTSGYHGTATSGDYGTSTSGYYGTSMSGDYGTSMSGYHGTATAGDGGVVCIRYRDEKSARYRLAVGYVGEDGIEPNRPYRVDNEGKFYLAEGK